MTQPSQYSASIARLLGERYSCFIQNLPDALVFGEYPQERQEILFRKAYHALVSGKDPDSVLSEMRSAEMPG